MSYVVLALKWRPQTFDAVAGQRSVSLVLKRALETRRTGHAYLFSGPRGVGKTSMARILAKALNCETGPTPSPCGTCAACVEITRGASMDVLEIDGASNRGIDDIRELKETVRYAPSRCRTKVTIIDEVHMLTPDAFNALLKTLEEPPGHAVFILATTEPLKVPQTIISRCQRFDFGRLTVPQIVAHLAQICEAESISMEKDALTLLARRSEGSVRDALTLLDQVAASGKGPHDAHSVQDLLGLSGRALTFDLTEAMSRRDVAGVLRLLDGAYQQGFNVQELMEELIQHVRNLMLLATDRRLEEMLDATEEERKLYGEQVKRFTSEDLLRVLRILMDESGRMRRSPFPRLHIELALAECAALPSTEDLARILKSLGREEDALDRSAGTMGEVDASPAPFRPAPARETELTARETRPPAEPRPPAAQAKPPAAGSEDQGKWREVLTAVRAQKIALATCLETCRVVGIGGRELLIERRPGDAFLTHQMESPAHRRIVQEAVGAVYGSGITCRFVEASPDGGGGPSGPIAAASADPVKRIARLMDGEVHGPAT